ncbi:unnamed protein product [Alternaria alternata]
MPVTITVADHKSESYHNRNAKIASNDALLRGTSPSDSKNCKWIIQSSVSEDEFSKSHIVESNNGFVHAAFTAYSRHHHLVIRPEDVWFAIRSQLNVYINANAEALRDHFVSHQGQKSSESKSLLSRTIFWSKIAHHLGGGSGPSYLGGWLTAFCFWNDKGECMYDQQTESRNPWETDSDRLELDGVSYHDVDISNIPNGFASVPVLVDDNGKEYKTKMIAGSLGIKVTGKDNSQAGTEEKLDSLQSLSGWMMYEIKE